MGQKEAVRKRVWRGYKIDLYYRSKHEYCRNMDKSTR